MTKVLMVQVSPQRWQLESESGTVVKDDLLCYSEAEAETWVKSWISTYPAWGYVMKPKKEETK